MSLMKNLTFGVVAMAVAGSIQLSAFAMENGIYEVDTKTYYLNPDTGKTDDGGTANIELGEGMCRSAIYEKATLEKNAEGISLNMRMLLYSNLSNIRIAVQNEKNGEYTDIKYSVIKESASNDSAELKFNMPKEDSLIRIKMYVEPMGRDVCFYMSCNTENMTLKSDTAEIKEEENTTIEQKSLFEDIKGHWAEKEINAVVQKGLFSGTSETTFQPELSMTRGMFVTVLGRLSGEEISGGCNFSDVDNKKYYASYIGWANEKGIVNGVSENSFKPDEEVTCEQAATILVKYAEYKGIELKNKSISPSLTEVSLWAKENVIRAGKAGIITKQNTNGYGYKTAATRADVASMLYNLNEFYGG